MELKYLSRVITALYDNWLDVVGNLKKAWRRCTRMPRILGQEGADLRAFRNFYKAVVQAALLF